MWKKAILIFGIVFAFISTSNAVIRVDVLGKHVRNNQVDIAAGETATLRCVGESEVEWVGERKNLIGPQDNSDVCRFLSCRRDSRQIPQPNAKCDTTHCFSEISLNKADVYMTGSYGCFRKHNASDKAFVYVFVNDESHLIVPYRGRVRNIALNFETDADVKEVAVPCKPSISSATVQLWSWNLAAEAYHAQSYLLKPDLNRYDSRSGYVIGPEHKFLECRISYGNKLETSYITVHGVCNRGSQAAKNMPQWEIHNVTVSKTPDYIRPGDKVELSCSALAFPNSSQVSLQWTSSAMDEPRMIENELRQLVWYGKYWQMELITRKLIIDGIQPSDDAHYTCWHTESLCNYAKGTNYTVPVVVHYDKPNWEQIQAENF